MNAIVFASGSGTNFEALMDKANQGLLDVKIVGLVCDKEQAAVRAKAERLNVPQRWYNPKAYTDKAAYEADILVWLKELNVDMIVLSGYMRIVGKTLLEAYPNAIVNLHPALLPAFPGAHSIQDVFEAKVDHTGVTVHFIDDQIDQGQLIIQERVDIDPTWTLEQLETAVHAKEYDLFYRGVNLAAKQIQERESK